MSTAVDSSRAWENEFRARFGVAPGTPDEQTERERLVQMCGELLAERDSLRAELERLRTGQDTYYHAFGAFMKRQLSTYPCDKDTLVAEVAGQPSLQELIAELKRAEAR